MYLDTPPQLATRKQLERIFPGLSARTLANWASAGYGPRYFRKGKNAWYDIAEVRAFLTETSINTNPASM